MIRYLGPLSDNGPPQLISGNPGLTGLSGKAFVFSIVSCLPGSIQTDFGTGCREKVFLGER